MKPSNILQLLGLTSLTHFDTKPDVGKLRSFGGGHKAQPLAPGLWSVGSQANFRLPRFTLLQDVQISNLSFRTHALSRVSLTVT